VLVHDDHISDPVLEEQYEKVIAVGGRIAGPAAEALLANRMDQDILDWLKDQLLQDRARTRPLSVPPGRRPLRVRSQPTPPEVREAERHTAISGRICELLTELGEPARPYAGEH
jgi:hypothetical protein